MKKIIIYCLAAAAALSLPSCEIQPLITGVTVTFTLTDDGAVYAEDNIGVTVSAQNNSVSYEGRTEAGVVTFDLVPGLYTVSASFKADDYIYNLNTSVVISEDGEDNISLALTKTEPKDLIIKELYVGGCQNDEGSGSYYYDKYVILYNNSAEEIDISDVAFAIATPANSNGQNRWLRNGQFIYEPEGWIPAGWNIWWFNTEVSLPAYSQIVVAIYGAINHTRTYSNSVDLSDAGYYAMYDPEAFGEKYDTNYYPNPSDNIDPSHYLQTYLFSQGTAWPVSNTGPAFYILEYADIESYVQDDTNYDRTESANLPVVKVERLWVLDGIDVMAAGLESSNNKRFTSDIDAGSIYMTSDYGYTLYRNVDKEATEALPENAGKLVYGYTGGTVGVDITYGSTDPSGIDAEASIANGAHIIYMETNNSSSDFHQRRISSLKN